MRRRNFLLNVVALSLASAQSSRASQESSEVFGRAERLIQLLSNRYNASIIGKTILRKLPHYKDAAFLVQELTARLALPQLEIQWPSCRELRHRFEMRTSQEFRLGRLTLVDGWMLAESEAQIFSLAALAESRQTVLA